MPGFQILIVYYQPIPKRTNLETDCSS